MQILFYLLHLIPTPLSDLLLSLCITHNFAICIFTTNKTQILFCASSALAYIIIQHGGRLLVVFYLLVYMHYLNFSMCDNEIAGDFF